MLNTSVHYIVTNWGPYIINAIIWYILLCGIMFPKACFKQGWVHVSVHFLPLSFFSCTTGGTDLEVRSCELQIYENNKALTYVLYLRAYFLASVAVLSRSVRTSEKIAVPQNAYRYSHRLRMRSAWHRIEIRTCEYSACVTRFSEFREKHFWNCDGAPHNYDMEWIFYNYS